MHRLRLTWLANEDGPATKRASTFRILFWIGIVYWIISAALPFLTVATLYVEDQLSYVLAFFIVDIVILVFAVFLLVLVSKTRKYIRNKYQIPAQRCSCCEDLCCSFWCTCCAVAQMARHTGDYEAYRGMCCSETGLPPHAPSYV